MERLLRLWFVQVFARRKFRELFQVLGPQGTAEIVFLGEPLAQVHQLAAMRTEGDIFASQPITAFPARRTLHLRQSAHVCSNSTAHFESQRFEIGRNADGNPAFHRADFQNRLGVLNDLIELGQRK